MPHSTAMRPVFPKAISYQLLPHSVDAYAAFVRAIDRKVLAVSKDPENLLVVPRICCNTGALLRECFAKFGKWIVSCHAKDWRIRGELAMHFDEVRVGTGNMDYGVFLGELNRLHDPPPLMLEHLGSEAEYATARDHIFGAGRSQGIDFCSSGKTGWGS